jgi:hypothetical protein
VEHTFLDSFLGTFQVGKFYLATRLVLFTLHEAREHPCVTLALFSGKAITAQGSV